MVWWDENGAEYVFRLATNERLVAKIARELRRAGLLYSAAKCRGAACSRTGPTVLASTVGYTAAASGSKLQLSAGGPNNERFLWPHS